MDTEVKENRWSIWIDVEGFTSLYRKHEGLAIRALGELMEALFKVGSTIFANVPKRLFIHQFGDGFVVVSDFPEERPDRPIAICLAVMRHLVSKGVVTKAAISGGGFADIGNCYPDSVLAASTDRRHVNLGDGVMTIIPVMGTALTAAHKLATRRSGAILLFDPLMFVVVPGGVTVQPGSPAVIDWVHSDHPDVRKICQAAGLNTLDAQLTEARLNAYIDANRADLSEEWISSTLESVNMTVQAP